jgi:hypothetical protein
MFLLAFIAMTFYALEMMDLPSLMIIGAIILIILFLQHKGKGDEK